MIRVRLTGEQRQDLHLRARREVGRVSEPIHFALLSDRSHSSPKIADLFCYCAGLAEAVSGQGSQGCATNPAVGVLLS